MERAIDNKPLFNEDIPPIAQSHENISIAVDATGPFANPFAAAAAAEVDSTHAIDDAKKMDAKVSSVSFAEKNKICPEIWTQGKFQMTRHNVGKKTAKYYCRNKCTKDCKCSFAINCAKKMGLQTLRNQFWRESIPVDVVLR